MEIVLFPDPRLRAKNAPIENFDEELAQLAAAMFEAMYRTGGVGLAAPQVGVNRQLLVFNEEGKVQVVDLSAPEGRIAGEMDLGEMIQCSPAVSNGALYVRSNRRIWKIARKTQL